MYFELFLRNSLLDLRSAKSVLVSLQLKLSVIKLEAVKWLFLYK